MASSAVPIAQEMQAGRIALYTTYLEDLGRFGSRHASIRKFYVSVVSALFAFLAMAGKDGPLVNVRGFALDLVGLAGIVVSLAWFEHMRSFGRLYAAKFDALREMEKDLPAKPFTLETGTLEIPPPATQGEKKRQWKYTPLTFVDSWAPIAFAILFASLLLAKLTSPF